MDKTVWIGSPSGNNLKSKIQNLKWAGFFAILLLVGCVGMAEAQQAAKVYRIGALRSHLPSIAKDSHEAFRQGLRELGYVEGKNILIEYRYAEGKLDRLPALAEELVRLKVDVILVGGGEPTRAAKRATSTIPIVVGGAGDLVGEGLVASLAKPGGNITGSTLIAPDLSGKRLELLREVVPKASRVAVLFGTAPGDRDELRATETAARQLGVKIQPVEVRDPNEFQIAYAAMTKQQAHAVIIILGPFTNTHLLQIVQLTTKSRLPSMCETSRQRFRIHGWKWLKNLYMGLGESASQIRTTFFGSGSLEITIRAARESCKGNTTLCSYAG